MGNRAAIFGVELASMYAQNLNTRDRGGALAAVVAIHAALAFAFLNISGTITLGEDQSDLQVFDVREFEPPPPTPPPVEEQRPEPEQAQEPEGAAAPENIRSQPTPIVAPEPRVRLPVTPPVAVTRTPGEGAAPTQGASEMPGPGTGAGGTGAGTGAGGSGTGAGGGGGIGRPPQLIRGNITRRDYPRELRNAPTPRGVIEMEFTIGTDGRVRNCRAIRSSGSSFLDASTCRLVEQRYVYRPALDTQGRPTTITGRMQRWWWNER